MSFGWDNLTDNQMVSYTDAQGSPFSLNSGQSPVTSEECLSKSEALTKYSLNPLYMGSFASNQLAPKVTWQQAGVTCYSYNIYYPGTEPGSPPTAYFSYTLCSGSGAYGSVSIGNSVTVCALQDSVYIEPGTDAFALQASLCSSQVTWTYTRSGIFFKNNCGARYQGSAAIEYTKQYTSTVSYQDAINQSNADTSFNSDGQAYANSVGSCVLYTVIPGNIITPLSSPGINDTLQLFRQQGSELIGINYNDFPNSSGEIISPFSEIWYSWSNTVYVPWNGRYNNTGIYYHSNAAFLFAFNYNDGTGRKAILYVTYIIN
jgi:hypothetical protein